MRALLVANPKATTTSARTRDVIAHALSASIDLDVVETTHRSHATDLARQARRDGLDVVLTLGGDGTVNEVVNGLLAEGPGHDVPVLGAIPGGSANVFARSTGLPDDPVEATGALLEAIEHKRTRTIGLGIADTGERQRWFLCNAGVGLDAEIVEDMEHQRAKGKEATPGRYFQTALRHILVTAERKQPALAVHRPDVPVVEGVFLAIVQNSSPWTFLGPLPVDPCPRASFDTGLDLFAPRSLAVPHVISHVRRFLTRSRRDYPFGGLLALHDQPEFTVRADPPMSLQIDGDSAGPVREVTFRSAPQALSVLV
ncbi:MAG TPA: diacylglycerol kinase family protein [Candidatus Nanopelagicales bacterium]|nr:diacylglycerol kinase family protein [Candidatus Nanopelagicales bacterium]